MIFFATILFAVLPLVALSQATFNNPVIYEDFADNDVFLGPDGFYYFSASSFHYSPGAPILKSADLINWEFVGHSVPTLDFGDDYNMDNGTAYNRGVWASTLRYRNSTGLWHWYGCIDFWNSYGFTAPSVTGPWTQTSKFDGPACFYDCGLLIDDDDSLYIIYGSNNVSISQLSADGTAINKTKAVWSTPSQFSSIEGNRLYKRNGLYYAIGDAPGNAATLIWKAKSIWGPWTEKTLQQGVKGPVPGGSTPFQGSLIETPDGDWFFMSFAWSYPSGRLPVLAPLTWGDDDFPILGEVNGTWGASYPNPLSPLVPTPSWNKTDTFPGNALGVDWEWNMNPDTTKYNVNVNADGVTLFTATVTDDIFSARNTLTHRTHGPVSIATVVLDTTKMADGDSTGFACFRDQTAWIGVTLNDGVYTLSNVQGALQNGTAKWATISDGKSVANTTITKGKIWLRGIMNAAPTSATDVGFQYSTDGETFKTLGTNYSLNTNYEPFMGYRWAIFNFATKALGGSVVLSSFTLS